MIRFRLSILLILFLIFTNASAQAKEWQMNKVQHFIVYSRSDVPEDFVNTVMESAEENYKSVLENIGVSWYQGWSWDRPVLIYIYRDQEDYVQNGAQAGWSHGAALIATRTIRTFPSDQGFFDAILPHELGHIVLHEFVGLDADVPLWFDEGVAMFQEKAKRLSANKIVRDALSNGQFISLTALSDMRLYVNSDPKTIELFYAESASIVNFMINELGKGHFYKMCIELKEHTKFVDALTKIYMNIYSLDGLNKKWLNYLQDRS